MAVDKFWNHRLHRVFWNTSRHGGARLQNSVVDAGQSGNVSAPHSPPYVEQAIQLCFRGLCLRKVKP